MDEDLWGDWPKPVHCSTCGRKLLKESHAAGYDRVTGERKFETWYRCPRFPRRWFMVWFGGVTHDCLSGDNPMIAKRYC